MTATLTKRERSERTRGAIIKAAREHFARHGFDGTTIRAVAASAGIDPSMVMRYFTSKRNLFAVAMDLDLALPDLSAVPPGDRGRVAVEHFLLLWEGPEPNDLLRILLASAATNSDAAKHVENVLKAQLEQMVRAVIADPGTAEARAGLIATQLLGLALGRHILQLPQVVALDQQTIVRMVGPVIQRYLTAPLTD